MTPTYSAYVPFAYLSQLLVDHFLTRVKVGFPLKFVSFIAVALAFRTTTVAGTNFDICLASVRNGSYGVGVDIGGTDNRGHPVDVSVATSLTYRLCVEACGSGQEPFQWSIFSQQFSSWLLPWLTLVSQLPFGANDKLDNLDSVLLTVGSPTLAAYSLALTVLNSRWVARRFAKYTYPNVRNAIRILSSLQQSPIRVVKNGGLLASLIVLSQNDKWWSELAEWIDYTHTWSISAATPIAWVVIAYVFTVIDSFTGGVANSINFNGQGVGSVWMWLLPIIIGWLQISPKCDSTRISSAVERANRLAHVATDEGNIILVNEGRNEAQALELPMTEEDDLRRDEKCTAPVYNYARFFPWVQVVEDVGGAFQAASDHFHNHNSVDPSIDWIRVERGEKLHERNRVGTRAQVEAYCTLGPHTGGGRSRWGPKVLSRMFIASVLALTLQWGTAGAAVIVVWYTPTRGLGCRSASYLLYAVLSTIVWMLLVTSSILTHYVSMRPHYFEGQVICHWPTSVATRVSITFRQLGKLVAAFNTLWVVASCLFQFGSVFDNCYCNSSVFWLRDHAYNVIELVPGDIMGMIGAWIGGVCLAGGAAVIYVAFVNVFIGPPLPD